MIVKDPAACTIIEAPRPASLTRSSNSLPPWNVHVVSVTAAPVAVLMIGPVITPSYLLLLGCIVSTTFSIESVAETWNSPSVSTSEAIDAPVVSDVVIVVSVATSIPPSAPIVLAVFTIHQLSRVIANVFPSSSVNPSAPLSVVHFIVSALAKHSLASVASGSIDIATSSLRSLF